MCGSVCVAIMCVCVDPPARGSRQCQQAECRSSHALRMSMYIAAGATHRESSGGRTSEATESALRKRSMLLIQSRVLFTPSIRLYQISVISNRP